MALIDPFLYRDWWLKRPATRHGMSLCVICIKMILLSHFCVSMSICYPANTRHWNNASSMSRVFSVVVPLCASLWPDKLLCIIPPQFIVLFCVFFTSWLRSGYGRLYTVHVNDALRTIDCFIVNAVAVSYSYDVILNFAKLVASDWHSNICPLTISAIFSTK